MPTITLGSGLQLSYSDQGERESDRAVVLIPGPTDSWRSFDPVLASMPGHLQVVAVSMRGHGDSAKPPTGYSIEDLASDIVPLLNGLGIERAVLVGHSGSCLVARRVALDTPDRVVGLLLEGSPSTLRGDRNLSGSVDTVVSTLTSPIDRELARSSIADTSSENLASDLVEGLVDDLVKVPVHVWNEMFASLIDYDDTAELARVEVPVRLVWGDDDALVSRQMQDQLVDLLPRGEFTVYAGIGHTPRWGQPGRFARELAQFASPLLG